MEKIRFNGFVPVSMADAACVIGGVDKTQKDLYYYVGYLVGTIVSLLKNLFHKK